MSNERFRLSKRELKALNRRFPVTRITNVSSRERALEVVSIFLRHKYGKIKFLTAPKSLGSDLRYETNGFLHDIEVKGTAASDIAWGKLKMSGNPSFKAVCAGRPVYRVFDLYSSAPKLRIMQWGKDFTLKPEPRWRFCPQMTD